MSANIRVQLAENVARAKAKPSAVIMVPGTVSFEDLVRVIMNKLRAKRKGLRLFGCDGIEVTADTPLAPLLHDGVVFIVSKDGSDFRGTGAAGRVALPPVPRAAVWASLLAPAPSVPPPAAASPPPPVPDPSPALTGSVDMSLCGRFAVLAGPVLDAVRAAVRGHAHYHEYDAGGGLCAFDYEEGAVFPSHDGSWANAVLAECRGLWFHKGTHTLAGRMFHKFFQLDELTYTPDLTGAIAYEKYDGTLVAPLVCGDGGVVWVSRHAIVPLPPTLATPELDAFARTLAAQHKTGLFEWCTRVCPVGVLTYPCDALVLLAVRHHITGVYDDIEAWRGVAPCAVVEEVGGSGRPTAAASEGVVCVLPSGERYKRKTKWWLSMTRAVKACAPQDVCAHMMERGFGLDAVPSHFLLASCLAHGSPLPALASLLSRCVDATVEDVLCWARGAREAAGGDAGLRVGLTSGGWPGDVAFAASQGDSGALRAAVLRCVSSLLGKGEVVGACGLLGAPVPSSGGLPCVEPLWQPDREPAWLPVSPALCAAALEALPALLPSALSVWAVPHTSGAVCVPFAYAPLAPVAAPALTLSLCDIGDVLSCDSGTTDTAVLRVACGEGVVASVGIPSSVCVRLSDVAAAAVASAHAHALVCVSRGASVPPGPPPLFCDLDGVLADFEAGVVSLTGKGCDQQEVRHMWRAVMGAPDFFATLPWMPGAQTLWGAIAPCHPIILTGMPSTKSEGERKRIERAKGEWVRRELGPDVRVITCDTADKWKYARGGSVLIDDRASTGPAWRQAGGVFIHHTSVDVSVWEVGWALGAPRVPSRAGVCAPLSPPPLVCVVAAGTMGPPALSSTDVAVCVQWDLWCPAALVTVATPAAVYVCDIVRRHRDVLPWLWRLLGDAGVTKAMYGLGDEGDVCTRIAGTGAACVDVREGVARGYVGWEGGVPPTLPQALRCVSGADMAPLPPDGDAVWSERPLSPATVDAAAMGAWALLRVHTDLVTRPPPRTLTPTAPPVPTPVTIQYSCLALTEEGRAGLAAAVPARLAHKGGCGDHATVCHGSVPPGFSPGCPMPLTLTGTYCDGRVQAVRVSAPGWGDLHITLSLGEGAEAAEAARIPAHAWTVCEAPLTLLPAVTCVVVSPVVDVGVPGLSPRLASRLRAFLAGADTVCEFRPKDLSVEARGEVATHAVALGMTCEVVGTGPRARLVLTKGAGGRHRAPPLRHVKVCNPGALAALTCVPPLPPYIRGRVCEGGAVAWLADPPEFAPHTLIILRGLPGSGKSALATALCGVIISADEEEGERDDAHAACRAKARDALTARVSRVIIDNTHTEAWEYAPYLTMAASHGYGVCVLELVCDSVGEALACGRRSTHSVHRDRVLAMHTRWEADEAAILLAHFRPHGHTHTLPGEEQ